MNLKLRFALLFTLFVAGILFISSITIYYLNHHNRESEFFDLVKREAIQFHEFRNEVNALPGWHTIIKPLSGTKRESYDIKYVVLDLKGTIIEQFPQTKELNVNSKFIQYIIDRKEYKWYGDDNSQFVGIYLNEGQQILIASGYDAIGFDMLSNLRIILLFVFLGGLLLTGLFSFFFVKQSFKPLKNLSQQMRATSIQNLEQRIDVHDENNEINDIARNYNSMMDRLSKAFEFQKSFVYHASHELRTPLATMLSQTESALEKKLTDAEYKEVLLSLKEDQQEMIELTNSLLLISQFEQMGQVQNWPKVRIDEVLYETMSITKRMFPTLNIEMSYGTLPESDNDFEVNGNTTLLKSVFSNLIKNAFYYSTNQKVKITIESEGGTILIHFDNEGTQLPADEKENIMTPFFRGGNALKTKGYGLGLAIVHRFMTIHKGTITYTPISNDINRFTITMYKAEG